MIQGNFLSYRNVYLVCCYEAWRRWAVDFGTAAEEQAEGVKASRRR